MKKNIALVAGGYSGEYEISIRSAGQIAQNIDREKYNVYTIVIEKSSWYYCVEGKHIEIDKNDFSLTLNGEKINFEGALIIVHGTPGENGLLQGYFDMLNIPYTTCSALVSTITFDKEVCNALVRSFDIVNVAKNTAVANNIVKSIWSAKWKNPPYKINGNSKVKLAEVMISSKACVLGNRFIINTIIIHKASKKRIPIG